MGCPEGGFNTEGGGIKATSAGRCLEDSGKRVAQRLGLVGGPVAERTTTVIEEFGGYKEFGN